MNTGGCACGAVRYEVSGDLTAVTFCHCSKCRRWHGHVGAYTAVDRPGFRVIDAGALAWFELSPTVRRGFCSRCGSSLFWDETGEAKMSICAGTLDAPTGLTPRAHIFLASKGDYYEVPPDGLLRFDAAPFDRRLVKETFQVMLAREPHLPRRFYAVFFARHPEIEPMFSSRASQEVMLAKALVAIIDRVDDAPWLESWLDGLGERHRRLPIRPEMWGWFHDAMLATFAEILDERWTPEVARAWGLALADIVERVRRAACPAPGGADR